MEQTESNNSKTNRLYAFDQLRAIMIILGIFLHAGTTYVVRDISNTWPLKDVSSTSLIFDVISGYIHTFRMPLFFVVSGFFTSMLFFVKGPKNMLRNRLKRIFYPLIVGLIILYPLYLLGVHYFYYGQGKETVAVITTLKIKLASGWDFPLIHLWFLYYLMMFCLAGWVLACMGKILPEINHRIKSLFKLVFSSSFAPLLFALFTILCLTHARSILIDGSMILAFNFDCFVTHGYFFFFGWMLYLHRDQLNRFLKQDKLLVVMGTVLFFVVLFLLVTFPNLEKSNGVFIFYVCDSIIAWCFIFGFIGLSLRFQNHYSSLGQYMSDASYWIYLVHQPLIILFQGMLVKQHFHGLIKFTIVVVATSAVTIITYNYFVRNTFIGQFLSGKKIKRGFQSDAGNMIR